MLYQCMNALSMSDKCFANVWKIASNQLSTQMKDLRWFLFLYSKANIPLILNVFNSLKNSCNFFLIIGLVSISCNSGSKKIRNHNVIAMYTIIRRIWLHHRSTFFYLISCCSKDIKQFSNFCKIVLFI